jgi:hypothetical protein
MKKINLTIIGLLVATAAFATQPTQTKFEQLKNAPTLRVEIPEAKSNVDEPFARPARSAGADLQSVPFSWSGLQIRTSELGFVETKTEERKPITLTSKIDEHWPKFDPKSKRVKPSKSDTKDYHKWDSLQLYYPDGRLVQTLYLTYTIIDGLYYPALSTVRDMATRRIVSERGYEYHTEGPSKGQLKSWYVRDWDQGFYGDREVFYYNDKGFVDSIYYYQAVLSNGNWSLQARYYYENDAVGNPTRIETWQPLIATGEWLMSGFETAEYREDSTRIQATAWFWGFSRIYDQEQWIGMSADYDWYIEGIMANMLRQFYFDWDGDPITDIYYLTNHGAPTNGEFIGDSEVVRTWVRHNGRDVRTFEKWSFWNKEHKDWRGDPASQWTINREEFIDYAGPEFNYRLLKHYSKRWINNEWIPGWTTTYTWSLNPYPVDSDWEWAADVETIHYSLSGESWISSQSYTQYSKYAPGMGVYVKLLSRPGTVHEQGQEQFSKFNTRGGEIETIKYTIMTQEEADFFGVPRKVPMWWDIIERDENNHPVQSKTYSGGFDRENDNAEVWHLSYISFYEHTNGYRTYQMGYRDEAKTIPLQGRRIYLDVDIPLSDIIRWEDIYYDRSNTTTNPWFPYLVETYIFFESSDWGNPTDIIDEYLHVYHYSIEKVSVSNQEGITIDGQRATVTVFPNPVNDVLYIQTEDAIKQIFVFDLNGRLVKQVNGNRNSVDLSSLPAGHYVARIHTDKAVVPVRVVKQ